LLHKKDFKKVDWAMKPAPEQECKYFYTWHTGGGVGGGGRKQCQEMLSKLFNKLLSLALGQLTHATQSASLSVWSAVKQ